eukprot:jgi/Botrbrau1/5317/Bobra.0391s0028.1
MGDRKMNRNRRLGRKAAQGVNYAALHGSNEDEPGTVDYEAVRSSLLAVPEGPENGYDTLLPSEVTAGWLARSGFQKPVVVQSAPNGAQTLGIKLPQLKDPILDHLVARLGHATEVQPARSPCEMYKFQDNTLDLLHDSCVLVSPERRRPDP